MRIGFMTLCFLLLLSVSAFSQKAKKPQEVVDYFFNSGVSLPLNPSEFDNFFPPALNAGAGIGYEFSPNWLLRGYVGYHRFILNRTDYANSYPALRNGRGSVTGGDIDMFDFFFGFVSRITKKQNRFDPYFLMSGGIVQMVTKSIGVTMPDTSYTLPSELDVSIAVQIGAGVNYALSEHVIVFLEANYNYAFSGEDRTQYLPVKAGIKLRY